MPQVPPEVLRCVGFISPREDGDPDGTVFFVRVHQDDPDVRGPISKIYAVTAKHTLAKYVEELGSGQVWLRLNRKGGGVVRKSTNIKDWTGHADADISDKFLAKLAESEGR